MNSHRKKKTENLTKILLPKAPAEIQKRLMHYNNLGIKTYLVVHENAFKVSLRELESFRTLVNSLDPIICVDFEEEKTTVIVGQYGDFLEEKKMMDYIKTHFNIIQENYLKENLS